MKIEKIIKDFASIEAVSDLKKRGLTMADYDTLYYILQDLKTRKKAEFMQESIKKYLEKLGAAVRPCGVGFVAVLEK